MSESVADDLIQSGYRRWLQLEEAKAEVADDLKELMAELKGQGLIPKALRESFRRVRDQDNADKQEHDAMVDLYVACLTRGTRGRTREKIEEFPPAPERKTAGHARRDMGSEGANPGDEDVDGSATRAGHAGQFNDALSGQIESRNEFVERNTSGPDAKRAPHSHSSEPSLPRAETKADEVPPPPVSSATLSECSVGGGDDRTSVEEVHNPNLEEGVQQTPSLPDNDVPAFLLKPRGPLRPHCLNPDVCAGYGSNHCHSCLKSSELAEAS